MGIAIGRLDRLVRIEVPTPDDSLDGAGSGRWTLLDEVYAEVQDAPPSRAERLADGINMAARPARLRIRYRDDITPNMRFVLGERVMQIVAGPAELGRREALEFAVEDYSPAGNEA